MTPGALAARVRLRHRRQQRLGVGMGAGAEDARRRPGLDDAAQVHDRDALGQMTAQATLGGDAPPECRLSNDHSPMVL
mgnify:CR=1 FL=1